MLVRLLRRRFLLVCLTVSCITPVTTAVKVTEISNVLIGPVYLSVFFTVCNMVANDSCFIKLSYILSYLINLS